MFARLVMLSLLLFTASGCTVISNEIYRYESAKYQRFIDGYEKKIRDAGTNEDALMAVVKEYNYLGSVSWLAIKTGGISVERMIELLKVASRNRYTSGRVDIADEIIKMTEETATIEFQLEILALVEFNTEVSGRVFRFATTGEEARRTIFLSALSSVEQRFADGWAIRDGDVDRLLGWVKADVPLAAYVAEHPDIKKRFSTVILAKLGGRWMYGDCERARSFVHVIRPDADDGANIVYKFCEKPVLDIPHIHRLLQLNPPHLIPFKWHSDRQILHKQQPCKMYSMHLVEKVIRWINFHKSYDYLNCASANTLLFNCWINELFYLEEAPNKRISPNNSDMLIRHCLGSS